ncbi:MAG: hypothetical protein JW795_09580 [Chitinivibrionales bacterium]|nr:hypothetical protein [Chitinivibrionales bacterium]
MRATTLSGLLKKGDRVAVSNITGREASKVSTVSHEYCGNIVGGWALGKGGQKIESANGTIAVFATFEELLKMTPTEKHPNKILIYSPPPAVYGEVKEVVTHGEKCVETIFIVTEHVSIEVTAKISKICSEANIDVIGCNTLGMINTHDGVRIGAVGGDNPAETFQPGSVTVISNSGNMVNTISSYVASSGMRISYGISTGKDRLILLPMKDLLTLVEKDEKTKIVVLYIEPGGTYEHDAIEMMKSKNFSKPLVVYVAGEIAERHNVSLGHAGAVVEGKRSSASAKKQAFDEYFGIESFKPDRRYKKNEEEMKGKLTRGIRVETLHDIPKAIMLVADTLGIKRDMTAIKPLKLNPWFVHLGELGKQLPAEVSIDVGTIPSPYAEQFEAHSQSFLEGMIRQPMRNASHASSNDGVTPRVYGYSLMEVMERCSFPAAVILYWTGELPKDAFEEKLAEMTLIASLTNGPGTISAQGAKLSASAGNSPNTAMIATLASMGFVHGGNGSEAVKFLVSSFKDEEMVDPYNYTINLQELAVRVADSFKESKNAAKAAGVEYSKIPCLGHPVFKNDPVNFDPREKVISSYLKNAGKKNAFLEFYHYLATALRDNGSTKVVMAVNVDAAIACVWLGICWQRIHEKQMTITRATDIPFLAFALGRVAGGAGEYLDHRDFGTDMDMRVTVEECKVLSRPRNLKSSQLMR